MMQRNPKAFPALCSDHSCDEGGMSLRDWFAGQALAGYFAYPHAQHTNDASPSVAEYCYRIADAMMETRK